MIGCVGCYLSVGVFSVVSIFICVFLGRQWFAVGDLPHTDV